MAIIQPGVETAENQSLEYNPEFLSNYWYVQRIPLLNSVITHIADFTATKGWRITGNDAEKKRLINILENMRGTGKQDFNCLMANVVKTYIIGGDAFLEIIGEGDNLDLKMLAPDTITIMKNKAGFITEYIQNRSIPDIQIRFKPEKIIHFAFDPVSDQVHGRSVVAILKDVLIAKLQSEEDMAKIYHRYVKPIHIIGIDSEDDNDIEEFKNEWKEMLNVPEADIIVPKDSVTIDRAAIPQFATLDPLPWMQFLQEQIVLAMGVPEVVMGLGSQANSEATARIQFNGFEQVVNKHQYFLETTLKHQFFKNIFPINTPELFYEFPREDATETTRLMLIFKEVEASTSIKKEDKGKIQNEILRKLGIEPKAL